MPTQITRIDEALFVAHVSSSLMHWATRSPNTAPNSVAVSCAVAAYLDDSLKLWCDLTTRMSDLTASIVPVKLATNKVHVKESWWEEEDEEFDELPRGIINPSDRRKLYWDGFVCACVVYLTMTMPYSMGFNAEASCKTLKPIGLSEKPWRACIRYGIDLGVDLAFVMDMTLSCFTAYQVPTGALIGDRWMILTHYIKHDFFVDFASTLLPYILKLCVNNNPFIKSIKFVRIIRLSKLFKLTRLMKLKGKRSDPTEEPSIFAQPGLVSAVRMLMTLFVIAHMLACVWHWLIMLKDLNRPRHWINSNGLFTATTSRKYQIALYWAFTTMTTVGYGDISIVNNTERFVAMFAMIVGGACFGYIIGGVTTILENLDLSSTMHNEKMDAVKEYLYDRRYPPILATQIKKHFKNIFTSEGIFDMAAILETLPVSTAIDLAYVVYKDLIHKTPLLQLASCHFVVAIAPGLFPCIAHDGEFLFFEGSVGTHLYCITAGTVSIFVTTRNANKCGHEGHPSAFEAPPSVGISCGTCGVGQHLGDVAIMLTFTNPCSAYVLHKASLYSIKKEILVDALMVHDKTRDELLQIAHRTREHVCQCLASEAPDMIPTKQSQDERKGQVTKVNDVISEEHDLHGLAQTSCHPRPNSRIPQEISSVELWRDHGVIHPELPAKMTWDAIICILIIYSILAITYTISFGIEEPACSWPSNAWMGIDLCIDLCFGIDMALSFQTAWPDEGTHTLIYARNLIFRKYASGWLAIDLVSTVPIDKANCLLNGRPNAALRAIKMVRALRLVRLIKIQQKLKLGELSEYLEDYLGINPALVKLGKPLVVMGAVAHVLTCVFFAAARMHASWNFGSMRNETRATQYLMTLYWAFATMTTVGYGDVSPALENSGGLMVTMISQVLGTMIFAYVIGILVAIVTNLDPAKRHLQAEKSYVDDFLAEIHDISPASELLLRVRRNHHHFLIISGVFDEKRIIDVIPPHVRTPSIIYMHRTVLPYLPFFSSTERHHMGAVALALTRLKPASYSNGQIINSTRISARELHFVVKGCVNVLYTSTGSKRGNNSCPDEIYGPQTYFGDAMMLVPAEIQIRLKVRITCGSRSCHCFVISKADYDTLREAYLPIVQTMDGQLDGGYIKRWIGVLESKES